ncbi:MAG: prepilin peptidase, partial [Acidimicrobiia bacterium]|nr:prepilin peptidase [Acidimicrobiia bacterium]
GSFINVVAYRIPAGMSVVSPPSACPECNTPIRPRDNIPVLSWVLLRGRCRDCGTRISMRYPIVEVATAVLFVASVLVIGVEPVLPAYLWFAGVTLVLVLTDLDVKRIPNRILYPSTVVGAILLFGGAALDDSIGSFWRAALGAAVYFLLFLLLALIARGGFGFGDVKLAFFLGLFLTYQSWEVLGAGVALGIGIGGVVAILLLLGGKATRKAKIPFGPAMVFGAYAALVVGQELADWYLG